MKIELKKGADGVYRFEGEVPKDTAEMERGIMSGGIVDKIPSWKPGGIPVGRGLKAMVVAGAGDAAGAALIRYMPGTLFSGQYSVAVLKALTIWLLNWKPVKGFLGASAVEDGSIILAYEGLVSVFNARAKTFSLLSGVVGKLPGASTTVTNTAIADQPIIL